MIQLHLKAMLLFATTFVTLAFGARVLGVLQLSHPSLRGFTEQCEGKPQPCWFGIVPGVTTVNEIESLLAFAGEPDLSRSIFSQDFTLIFTLPQPWSYCRAAFEFVQGVAVRGEIIVCRQPDIRSGDLSIFLEQEQKVVSLPPNEMVYGRVSTNVDGWPKPYSRVSYIGLLPANARFQHFPWLGYLSQRRYCARVPSYPRCG